MPWSHAGTLRIVWWNTSLAPPVFTRTANDEDLQFVVEYVKYLRRVLKFDILALCEVNSSDLAAILCGLDEPTLMIHDATDRDAVPKHDTGIIYDSEVVLLEEHLRLTDNYFGRSLKTGEQMKFRSRATDVPFFLIASHWPSKLTLADHAPKKAAFGNNLQVRIKSIYERCPAAFVILVGDYNDEPYADSLAAYLGATRDRDSARRNSALLYNPFWRKLGESHDVEDSSGEARYCGTYYYIGGHLSRWHTFDQMIFSPGFLTDQAMCLNEEQCGVVASDELVAKVTDRGQIFDHLPVYGTVDLRSQE